MTEEQAVIEQKLSVEISDMVDALPHWSRMANSDHPAKGKEMMKKYLERLDELSELGYYIPHEYLTYKEQ